MLNQLILQELLCFKSTSSEKLSLVTLMGTIEADKEENRFDVLKYDL